MPDIPPYRSIEVIVRVRGVKKSPKYPYLYVVGVRKVFDTDKNPMVYAYNQHIWLDFSAN